MADADPATAAADARVASADPLVRKFQPAMAPTPSSSPSSSASAARVREIGGRKDGTDPTRYGDWEKNGRCIDF